MKIHVQANVLALFIVDPPTSQSDAQTRQDVWLAVEDFLSGPHFAKALVAHVEAIGLKIEGVKINP